jgi:hypothetical protein
VPEIGEDHGVVPRAGRAARVLRRIVPHGSRLPDHPLHVPLGRVVVCLDCEACFTLGADRCPACGSETWTLVARFLGPRPQREPDALRPALAS